MIWFVTSRQAKMLPVIIMIIRKNVPSKICFMNTLHYDYKGTCLWVIKTCLHGLIPPLKHSFTDCRAFCLPNIMRVVNNDYVTTFTSQCSINRGCYAITSLVIIKSLFLVLIRGKLKFLTEMSFVPRGI